MRRGRDVIGIPIMATGADRALGTVADLYFRPDGAVWAFLVAPAKGLFKRPIRVALARFDAIRDGKAYIEREKFTDEKGADVPNVTARGERSGLCGKNLITAGGKQLGTIADVVLDGLTQKRPSGAAKGVSMSLWGFEVSDGIVKDLLDGRPVVEAAGAYFDGDDVVLDAARKHMNLAPSGHDTHEGSE